MDLLLMGVSEYLQLLGLFEMGVCFPFHLLELGVVYNLHRLDLPLLLFEALRKYLYCNFKLILVDLVSVLTLQHSNWRARL